MPYANKHLMEPCLPPIQDKTSVSKEVIQNTEKQPNKNALTSVRDKTVAPEPTIMWLMTAISSLMTSKEQNQTFGKTNPTLLFGNFQE